MAENQLETPKAPAVEAHGSADLKMSHQAGELLREQPVQTNESTSTGNEVDSKFGTPEIDFGSAISSESATKKSGESEPDRAGKEFVDDSKSMHGAERLEAGDTNAMFGTFAEQSMDVDPVKEGIDLANEHFPGDSEADAEKRNSAFLALMKMKGEPGFENLDMENLTGKFSPKDLVSFAKMANEAGVFDSYGGGGGGGGGGSDITDNKIGPRVKGPMVIGPLKTEVPMD